MNVKIAFDFHDIFVDSANAWKETLLIMTNDKDVIEKYDSGISKKEICRTYNLDYKNVEDEYRKKLKPIEKNIKLVENMSKIYPIDIVSMARKDRILKDMNKFGIKHLFSNIYSKNEVKNRKEFLKKLSKDYDWLLFFNHEIGEIRFDENVIYFPINFQGDIKKFDNISFTEHAKNKLIYNELSDIYLQAIANDTNFETDFLDNIFKKYNKKGSVLDCCCGVGRHCRALAERGYNVTGIDISKRQIENTKKINNVKNIKYFNMDVRDFKLKNKNYDAGICMWTTYNYLSQDEDFEKFIKGIYNHLCNGGIFVLDSKNIPALEKERIYRRKNNNGQLDLELLICKRIVGNVQNSQYFYFMKRNGKKEFYMDEEFVRFYYLNEIKKIVKGYFDIVEVYGDFDMSKYDQKKSRRFILILKRK